MILFFSQFSHLCFANIAVNKTDKSQIALPRWQAAEKGQEVSIEQVPAVVKATILAQDGTIEEIEMETKNGQFFLRG